MDSLSGAEESKPIRKQSLRRVSVSDTHLPSLDVHHLQFNNKEKGPFSRVLSSLIEGTSNVGLNKSTDSIDNHKNFNEPYHELSVPPPASDSVGTSLHKSYSSGYYLFGHNQIPSSQYSGVFTQQSNIHTHPESDQGLIMNMSTVKSAPTIPITTTELGTSPLGKKSGFGGLFSLNSLFNKPLPVIVDKEENYRLIMALER